MYIFCIIVTICVCSVVYFIVHAAFVRIKLMTMMMINKSPSINHAMTEYITKHSKASSVALKTYQWDRHDCRLLNQFKTINTKPDGVSLKTAYIDKAQAEAHHQLSTVSPTFYSDMRSVVLLQFTM